MDYPIERKNKLIEYSLYLGCLLSNISQLPMFVRSGLTQQLAFPGWILLVIAIFLSGKVKINKSIMTQIGFGVALVVWLLMDSLLLSKTQFSSSMFYSYMISLFIFLLGAWSAEYVDKRVLKNINTIFVVSIFIVSANIFIEYFGVGYNLSTRLYAYSSKNSVSQIVFTAIILLIVRFRPDKTIGWVVKVGAIAFELYVILLLRSRATLVSLLLCILFIVFSRDTNKKLKAAVSIVSVGIIVMLLVNDQFNSFIFNNVVFANRNVANLNDLTSGRVTILSNFPRYISGNWLTGIGPTYYECFPLSAILQFGLIGGVLCILISLQPFIQSLRFRHIADEWYLLLLISAGYSVNGLFEGLTPFGPGVKCYYMWLLFGLLIGQRTRPKREGSLLGA